jgi:hypothetical protein
MNCRIGRIRIQKVTLVTEASGRFWQVRIGERECGHERLAVAFALTFAFTTGMAVVTVVAHTDRATADSAGTVVVYPERASPIIDGGTTWVCAKPCSAFS